MIDELHSMIGNINIEIHHVLREGNKLADYIPNLALDSNEVQVHSFSELNSKGKGIVNSDKLQLPSIRGGIPITKPNPT